MNLNDLCVMTQQIAQIALGFGLYIYKVSKNNYWGVKLVPGPVLNKKLIVKCSHVAEQGFKKNYKQMGNLA